MGSRSTGLLLLAFSLVLVLGAGCGGAGAPSIGSASTTVAPTVAAAAAAPAAAGQATLHGPPAGWEGHPPLHVHRFLASIPVGYTPAQITKAYGFSGTGAGQTIAIVDAYGSPTIQNDLDVFCTQFGLPKTAIISPSGGGGGGGGHKGGNHAVNAGWALETSLDVEWAHAMAPSATIMLSVAKSASITDLVNAVDAAVAAGATVVSMSWGGSEWSGEASYDSHFSKTGVSFTASSGDSGAGAEWPAVSPNVTGVGGTTLSVDGSGNYSSESGWSGSGGGPSKYVTRPAYQNGWQANAKRTTPDIALDADPNTGVAVYDSTKYNGQAGWFQIGGTSVGAPIWAALIALANQAGATPLSGANLALYGLGSSSYGTDYRDVKTGSNGYAAGTGYDMVTGIGTPLAGALIPALN